MVKSIFSLLTGRQTSILSGAAIIMATVMLSKILGLIRNRLLVHVFTPEKSDVFFASLQMPDLAFQLLILGALSVAFIPVFTEYIEKKGRSDAFAMARSVLNVSLAVFILVSVIIFVFSTELTAFIFPKYTLERVLEVASLTRVIVVGQILLTVGSFFIGILQSFQRFIIPAVAGVFYNLGIILGIVFLSGSLGIMAPAVGVVIGALMHILIQFPLIRKMGFRFSFPPEFRHPGVKEILKLMSFRSIGLAAEQVNEKIGISLSSLLQSGSLTYLTFAQGLQVVPISLFGATLAQAALPVLSAERARGKMDEFKITLLTTMHQILFLTLPATALLIVIRIPVVRLVFGASQFDWEATVLTGKTLAFLAIGLAAQSVCLLLVRGFYALKDTKTPVVVSLVVVAVNIILSLWFVLILKFDVWGIGFASALSALLSGVLLFWKLHKRVGGFDLKQVLSPFGKMLMATVIMGMALYIPIKLLDQVIFDTTRTVNLFILTGISSIFAFSVYIALVWYLRVTELTTYANLVKQIWIKMRSLPKNLRSEEIVHETDTF